MTLLSNIRRWFTGRKTYTFIGKDGSLGYRSGERYELIIKEGGRYPISITRADGDGFCGYGSWDAFRANWIE